MKHEVRGKVGGRHRRGDYLRKSDRSRKPKNRNLVKIATGGEAHHEAKRAGKKVAEKRPKFTSRKKARIRSRCKMGKAQGWGGETETGRKVQTIFGQKKRGTAAQQEDIGKRLGGEREIGASWGRSCSKGERLGGRGDN